MNTSATVEWEVGARIPSPIQLLAPLLLLPPLLLLLLLLLVQYGVHATEY